MDIILVYLHMVKQVLEKHIQCLEIKIIKVLFNNYYKIFSNKQNKIHKIYRIYRIKK
jgi:hypothetical protein